MSPRRAQRGIALLVAVLLVALGTIIAAAVAYDNAMTARRGTATYAFDQALLIGEGAEALAAYGLRQIVQSGAKTIYVGQGWDKPLGPFEVVPGAMLTASLEDLQGRFNLNNLVGTSTLADPVQVQAFNALLASVGLEEKWTGYIVDWISINPATSTPEGAKDTVYTGQTPPYRTANRYITSASELLALPGFGRDRYLKLAPYVTALPQGTRLNICTASGKVLDAYIGPGHSEFGADPEVLAKNRSSASGCFPTMSNYQAAFDQKVWAPPPTPGAGTGTGVLGQGTGTGTGTQPGGVSVKVTDTSIYFRLTSFVTIGSTEFNLYSLLYQDGNTRMVRAIQRSFTPD